MSVIRVLSMIFASAVLGDMFKGMGATAKINLFNPGCFTVLAITAVVVLCVFLILRKARDIKPVYALRGTTNSNTGKKKHGGMNASFSPFGIALRSIIREKRDAVGILIASVAVVFLINMGMVALEGANRMESENDYWLGIPSSEIIVELNDTTRLDNMTSLLESDRSVTKVIPWVIEKNVMLPWKEGNTETIMYVSVYENYDDVNLAVLEGRNPKTKDEIALAGKMADSLGLRVGDYMTVSFDGMSDISMLVTGIYQTYYDMGKHGRVCSSAYTERDVSFAFDKLSMFLEEGADRAAVIEKYSELFGDAANVIEREDCCKSIMSMIAAPQRSAIPPVVVLIMLIGGISIFCIVLLRNMKNEKTNQIYKSIGYTTRDLFVANVWYVELIGAVSMLIGVPVLLLSYQKIMTLALSIFGLREYRMDVNVISLILMNALILVSFAISSIISSRRLKKLNVRDLVSE